MVFIALSVTYSAPPVRLKVCPFLGFLSNTLYLTPMLLSWHLFSRIAQAIPLIFAGVAWCMAMHAYSAVPDIKSDQKVGLNTTALLLGRKYNLALCGALYLVASILTGYFNHFSGAVLFPYPVAMCAQLFHAPTRVAHWYKFFPMFNGLAGMLLTLRFLYPLTT